MRNRALNDTLRAFAERAGEHLSSLVESGQELPFEVAEEPGATSVLYRYRPLSDQFVRERFGELKPLEGFGTAVLALSRLEGLGTYLRLLAVDVPASDREQAELALREFLARLWDEVSTFTLEDGRFERSYSELEATVYDSSVIHTIIAPLIGVRLGEDRWELASNLALVRGDLFDAPPEAVWAAGREEREPNTLAIFTVEQAPKEPPPFAVGRLLLRKLLTALRLYRRGGVSLGPSAWGRIDEGPWQVMPLGSAGRAREGEMWLEGDEREELAELLELVRAHTAYGGPLPWALARFEMGCERPLAIEGLSDHLLALRALLEGDDAGPATVPARVAALCAEPPERPALEARIERAFRLQQLVMRGDLDADYMQATNWDAPEEIARDLEEQLRAILRDIVCGYLDADVRRVADDLLRDDADRHGPIELPDPEPPSAPPEEVVPQPEFVVRRSRQPITRRKPASAEPREETKTEAKPAPDESTGTEASDAAEQPTEEVVAVGGVRELAPDDDAADWGFDDDPSDYSAAV